jgi:hypothetical protein
MGSALLGYMILHPGKNPRQWAALCETGIQILSWWLMEMRLKDWKVGYIPHEDRKFTRGIYYMEGPTDYTTYQSNETYQYHSEIQ